MEFDNIRMMTKKELIAFTDEIIQIYESGIIRAPIHLCKGNEDILISIFRDIKPDDWVFSTYRNYYHALLKGIPKEWLKQQILAGHSMHINSKEYKFFTSSIVGGTCPIALGVAMAIKRKGDKNRVWCFIGDMAAETGIYHECLKYAERNHLPITYVTEDNGLGVNTPTQLAWGGEDPVFESCPPWEDSYWYTRVTPHAGTGKWIKF
jgi:TPP-dependent pyruvate/acetoin dehydrogenase alpha subunit